MRTIGARHSLAATELLATVDPVEPAPALVGPRTVALIAPDKRHSVFDIRANTFAAAATAACTPMRDPQ